VDKPIAEDLQMACPLCVGGKVMRTSFGESTASNERNCHHCHGTGRIWVLTMDELAKRCSAAEAERDALKAEVERLKAAVSAAERISNGD
jgi:hypothetical protein